MANEAQEEYGPAMADNLEEGNLNQDEINETLAAAGLTPDADVVSAQTSDPHSEESSVPASASATAQEPDAAVDPGSAESGTAFETGALAGQALPFQIPELQGAGAGRAQIQGIDLLRDVELDVKIELGRSRMLIDDVLRLSEGSVVELDKLAGDPVDVFVNDRLVARGEVLVLNDNFCVRINDILKEEADEEL